VAGMVFCFFAITVIGRAGVTNAYQDSNSTTTGEISPWRVTPAPGDLSVPSTVATPDHDNLDGSTSGPGSTNPNNDDTPSGSVSQH